MNGPIYPILVKDFQVRVEVYDELVALAKEINAVENYKSLKEKTNDANGFKGI